MKCIECGNDMGEMGVYLKDKDAGSKVGKKEIGCPECGTVFILMKGEDGQVLISVIEESRPQKEANEAEEGDVSKDPKTDDKMVLMDPNNERGKPYENSAGAYVWRPGKK